MLRKATAQELDKKLLQLFFDNHAINKMISFGKNNRRKDKEVTSKIIESELYLAQDKQKS
jgi:hypothetical protein